MKRLFFLLSLFLFFAFSAAAQAPAAPELTADCLFTSTVDQTHITRMMDGRYDRYLDLTGGALTITLPDGVPCQGLYLSFFHAPASLIIQSEDESGEWGHAQSFSITYQNTYLPFDASGRIRLGAPTGEPLKISRLSIYGAGELPNDVERWQTLQTDAELMLVVTHPDDDLIWFGGLLPTYAGEQNRRVMVVYTVGRPSAQRVNELLDGLWTCGVRYYPVIGPFNDRRLSSVAAAVHDFGGADAMPNFVTGVIRQYRPAVVVTQGVKGEYGHFQHIVTVQAVIDAVTKYAGDAGYAPASAEQYGCFTPKKLYLHMLRENELVFDWTQPLSAFGGKAGRDVAAEAFKKHISQQKSSYTIYMRGPYDSQRLGLFYSAVGPDEQKTDLFEHIDESGD